ncbi:MAG TPA: hypothetical protein VJ855_01160 [Marinilabiliaceae bacterium]|nr:hypothetical protein [Marinilabiliaceae bacterium]
MIQYISHLLHYHDCVIVPGLGGFVANHQTAQINEKQHLFLPPSKEIGFNRSLSHNDGLLTNYVAQQEDVSYSEATRHIDYFVAKIHSDVFAGQLVEMGNMGSFRGDAIGNLLFTPKETNTFLPDAFGLTSFRFEPLDYKRVVRMGYRTKTSPTFQTKFTRYWVAVAALMTGFFFLATDNLNTPTISQANLADIFNRKQEIVELPKIIAEEVKEASVATIQMEQPQKVENNKFHLIAASLKTSRQASIIKNDFVKQGFEDSYVLDDGSGHHRVALQSYSNLQEAVKEMKEYRKQSRFASVWVFKSR